jgi:hypothetical protein
MNARERDHKNAQEAYAQRGASAKVYQQEPAQATISLAEQQRTTDAQDREAYLARRKARIEQDAAAKVAAHASRPQEAAPQDVPGLLEKD